MLIRRIEPTAPANKVIKKGDILLSFDGVDIANDGTVPFRSGERISFNYLVSKKYTNEEVTRLWQYLLLMLQSHLPGPSIQRHACQEHHEHQGGSKHLYCLSGP